ncbi:hypothetical protein TOPH_03997 [Tolypocladium ophioglossoides CBS 100239]|uniref:Uncharacterized protein n=1 Tax=Tolypocladium ophioglossoides (strain CBS 100239) TaxID=1163406 RepID=A0A0L0NBH1_TOLOC|nr:hypothetical protein TOPH_03997 [Tolypocladium ophioglossoides CBS 100239]
MPSSRARWIPPSAVHTGHVKGTWSFPSATETGNDTSSQSVFGLARAREFLRLPTRRRLRLLTCYSDGTMWFETTVGTAGDVTRHRCTLRASLDGYIWASATFSGGSQHEGAGRHEHMAFCGYVMDTQHALHCERVRPTKRWAGMNALATGVAIIVLYRVWMNINRHHHK